MSRIQSSGSRARVFVPLRVISSLGQFSPGSYGAYLLSVPFKLAARLSEPPLESRFQLIAMVAIAHPGDTSVGTKQHGCSVVHLNTTDTRCPSFRDS